VRFDCSSCCEICVLTEASGVVVAGLTAESAWMMCQPYCVWIGGEV